MKPSTADALVADEGRAHLVRVGLSRRYSAQRTGLAPSTSHQHGRRDAHQIAAPAAVDQDARQLEHARLDEHRSALRVPNGEVPPTW